jgi:choline kinase
MKRCSRIGKHRCFTIASAGGNALPDAFLDLSMIKTAVILAAGAGTRMGDAGLRRPKGFIELGGQTIVERSLAQLKAVGIERIVTITGHRASFYHDLAQRTPGMELVHNHQTSSGSMYSLSLARDLLNEDFLLLESDLVYESRALTDLLEAPARNTLLVSGPTHSGDEVYVAARDGILTGLSKQRAELSDSVIGELVGITRLTTRCLTGMVAYADGVFRETLNLEYERALVAAGRDVPVRCCLVPDLIWSEIDNAQHLERATALTYPAIKAKDGN